MLPMLGASSIHEVLKHFSLQAALYDTTDLCLTYCYSSS